MEATNDGFYDLVFEQLVVDLDPRITVYPVLTDVDKGNNAVASAFTWLSFGHNQLGKHDSAQDTVNELATLIEAGFTNAWDYSNNLLIRLATEMHAIWVARALQRDGLLPERSHQVRLFEFLPKLGDQGIDESSDEPHYDIEAVVNALVYLLQAFMCVCLNSQPVEQVTMLRTVARILENYPSQINN